MISFGVYNHEVLFQLACWCLEKSFVLGFLIYIPRPTEYVCIYMHVFCEAAYLSMHAECRYVSVCIGLWLGI